jgi:hypothetical protein
VRFYITAFALFSLTGLVMGADLEESYTKLKDAVAKKDADATKSAAAETLKLAKAAQTAAKPTEAEEVEHWKQTIDYAKDVESYTEYALGFVASQPGLDPAKAVDMIDTLIAQNPKSKFIDDIAVNSYLVALGKAGGAAKQQAGMAKVIVGRPDNTVALQALVDMSGSSPDRALSYANRLIAAIKAKSKPEGFSESDWEKQKNSALATGYFNAGYVYLQKQAWVDCDKNLKLAVPLLAGDQARLGIAYYGLGACNFNFGKMTNDRTRMQAGEKYSEQSAAIKSPMQTRAYNDVAAMKQALAGR